MGFLLLATYASALAAVLGGPLGAGGDKVTWWSVDSAPLSPPHGSSHQDIGMNQWFTVYPDSYKRDDSMKTTSTVPPKYSRQYSGGYTIIDLRT